VKRRTRVILQIEAAQEDIADDIVGLARVVDVLPETLRSSSADPGMIKTTHLVEIDDPPKEHDCGVSGKCESISSPADVQVSRI
jgi:hypothetical protein